MARSFPGYILTIYWLRCINIAITLLLSASRHNNVAA